MATKVRRTGLAHYGVEPIPARYAAKLYPPTNDSRSPWTNSRGPVNSYIADWGGQLFFPLPTLHKATDLDSYG